MSKIIYNEHQIRQLELNPNVESVSDQSIKYTDDFKVRAVLKNQERKGPSQIFEEAGFDLPVIWRVKAKSALECWHKTYQIYGTEGLMTERRGKSNVGGGRPKQYDSPRRHRSTGRSRII